MKYAHGEGDRREQKGGAEGEYSDFLGQRSGALEFRPGTQTQHTYAGTQQINRIGSSANVLTGETIEVCSNAH